MQKIITILLIFITVKVQAQIPEDAIRYSWLVQSGNARTIGIGGAIGSLGGDLNATFVNPAGIGFYRTGEFSFSPSFSFNNLKTSFRGSSNNAKQNNFSFGTTGIVFGIGDRYEDGNDDLTKTGSIAFTQKANFNNTIYYKGLNNYSSFSEQFAEEFVRSKLSIRDALNSQSSVPFTAAPALFTYLIDTVRVNGILKVKAAPEYILATGQAIQQEFTKKTSGGMYELAGSYAINDGKKWLAGLSVGIPIVNFESNTTVTENDTSNRTNNYFKSFTYNDTYKTTGAGVNAKIGVIYRPKEYIRLGLAVHTPSYMVLTDERQATLKTELENPTGTFDVNSNTFTNGEKGKATYRQNAPWRVIVSGSYVFREVEDVKKQRGFIAADIEYVKHSGTKFSSNAETPVDGDKAYYKELTSIVKDSYKGAINAKIGGEVKFNTIMARLGFGYYGNPYKDAPTKASKMVLSGGLGYRNKGFFIDVAYAHLITKDFDVPYRLQNAETVYANTNKTTGNVVATFGVKF